MPHPRIAIVRRRRLKAAVAKPPEDAEPLSGDPPLRTVIGRLADVSRHVLVVITASGAEVRVPLSDQTRLWYGGDAGFEALRPGREVIVRPAPDALFADRVWIDIARVAGAIVGWDGQHLEVDGGPHRGRTAAMIPSRSLSRVQVRHPKLEPGYLADVIGVWSAGEVVGLMPGTSQPAHRADHPPRTGAHEASQPVRGTATWYMNRTFSETRAAAYPALDPAGDAGGCADAPAPYLRLPYLSRGSMLHVRNDCTGRAGAVPILECGCVAARFDDRCVTCGTSPRGRVIELTRCAFTDLGGDLETGCFNVAMTVG